MNTEENVISNLKLQANQIRKSILETANYSQQGHVGGSMSCADILSVLFFQSMNIDPENPKWKDRDRFVLSKGHTALGLYCAYAERGYIERDELATFDQFGSRLQAHPDMTKLDALDMSTGSLGQGLSVAVGMAIGSKRNNSGFNVYVLLGDGESQEGQVWEACHVASKYKLDNLIVIVDHNRLQQYGWKMDDTREDPDSRLLEKFNSFGFDSHEVDGHNISELSNVINSVKTSMDNRPKAIVANTIKGKGVSFIEDDFNWHSKAPTDEQLTQALDELDLGATI